MKTEGSSIRATEAVERQPPTRRETQMMQLVVFIAVLAVVFALKAVAIVKTHDDLAVNSASFSWAAARPQDEAKAEAWAEQEEADQRRALVSAPSMLRSVRA